MPTRCIAVSILFFSLLLAASAAQAESARLECSVGYGSYAVPRRWNPLYVKSDKALNSGRIEVRRLDREGKPLSLETFPYNESVRLECPIFMEENCVSIEVSLKTGAHTLASSKIELWQKVFPGHVALQVGMPSAVQRSLASLLMPGEPVQVVSVRAQDLPGLALDYDSVSAVMMSDPGASLSPAQAQAMRAWIAGGGRLVITGAHSAEKSILSSFGDRFVPDGAGAFGFGRIAAFRAEASELPRMDLDRSLRSAIALKPYGIQTRLTASSAFPSGMAMPASDDDIDRPGSILAIGLILWAGAVSALFFIHKRKLLYLFGISLLFSIAAIPVSLSIDRSWRRGGDGAVRLLALPEASGFLAKAEFSMFPAEAGSMPLGMTAWKLDLGFDVSEKGHIAPDAVASWSHLSWKPRFIVQADGKGRIHLAGFLPQLIADAPGLSQLFGELALADGVPRPLKRAWQGSLVYYSSESGLWYQWNHLAWRWIESGNCPPRFQGQEAWLRHVASQAGVRGAFAGLDSFKEMRFSIQGATMTKAAWAMPRAAGGL
jgi:hypothetical protein